MTFVGPNSETVSWKFPWFGSLILTPPTILSNFTWVNQGSATAMVQQGQTTFYNSSSTANSFNALTVPYRGIKRSVIGIICPTIAVTGSVNESAGLYIGDTGTNKWIEFTVFTTGSTMSYRVLSWTTPTASNALIAQSYAIDSQGPVFLSIKDDGINLYFDVSSDGGQNWDTLYQQARTTYLTNPNAVGFGHTFGYTSTKKRTNFIHWSVS
jgi:hypothetical protein